MEPRMCPGLSELSLGLSLHGHVAGGFCCWLSLPRSMLLESFMSLTAAAPPRMASPSAANGFGGHWRQQCPFRGH